MEFSPKICILLGATASGKSALAQRFAGRAVLLSADSLAIYRALPIISAAPAGEEAANYCGVGIRALSEDFCVADFLAVFARAKELARKAGKPLLVVGGTAFYVAALFSGLAPAVPRFAGVFSQENAAQTADLMRQIDPAATRKISPNDAVRLQRWQEIYDFSGTAPSEWLAKNTEPPALLREQTAVFELVWPREQLLERIAARTQAMLAAGAVREVAQAMAQLASEAAGGAAALRAAGGAAALRAAVEANKALGCIGAKQIAAALLERLEQAAGSDGMAYIKGNARAISEEYLMNDKNFNTPATKTVAAGQSTVFSEEIPAPSENPLFLQNTATKTVAAGQSTVFREEIPAPSENPLFLQNTAQSPNQGALAALLAASSALEADAAAMSALAAEIALRTRQYAKRQRTFCRKLAAVCLDAREPAGAERQIAAALGLER